MDPVRRLLPAIAPQEAMDGNCSRPYPFCLAYQLDHEVTELGDRDGWLAEWKQDGIRAQLIRLGEAVYL